MMRHHEYTQLKKNEPKIDKKLMECFSCCFFGVPKEPEDKKENPDKFKLIIEARDTSFNK